MPMAFTLRCDKCYGVNSSLDSRVMRRRMLVPTARLPAGMVRPMSTVWWGPGKHFVHYYVAGGEFVNCVCVVEKRMAGESGPGGDVAELREDFVGWHADIQELIGHADPSDLYKWALCPAADATVGQA